MIKLLFTTWIVLATLAQQDTTDDQLEGCVQHEWVKFITCGTERPVFVRIDGIVVLSDPENYSIYEPDIFASCIGMMLMNGRTLAVVGTIYNFFETIKRERGKWCRKEAPE